MKNYVEFFLFLLFSFVFRLAGITNARRFAYVLAGVFFYIIPVRREVTIANLAAAFPEKSAAEIRRIAFGCYKSFAITLIEMLCIPSLTPEKLAAIFKVENPDTIRQVHARGRGVILMTAHFANWEYAALATGIAVGIPLSVVVKQQRNMLVFNWLNKQRVRFGNTIVPLGASIRQLYKELKSKNIVALVGDQRGPEQGIRVMLFGRPSAVYNGPAALALKTGAPILMGITVRQPNGTYSFTMEELDISGLPEGEEEQIREISQRHSAVLEQYARRYPEQWLWMHKRWKW